MADYRDLEARGVPEHLWPDDAFQQKYTRKRILALTNGLDKRQKGSGKVKKGAKLPVRLEFEQRWMLDARRHESIMADLLGAEPRKNPNIEWLGLLPRPGILVHEIRQFYAGEDRYRWSGPTIDSSGSVLTPSGCVKEKKKTLRLGAPFAANSEDEDEVEPDEFETGWAISDKRLQKIRFQVPGRDSDHRTVVDFFYTNRQTVRHIYAVSAEDEVILDASVVGQSLSFDFDLPIYLHGYIVCRVDNNDPAMKIFRSANMIDNPDTITEFERAISHWYEFESV